MKILLRLIINVLIMFLIAGIVPGVYLQGVYAATITVIILAIVNVTLKPILIILTLPINILTLGLFTFVINALLLLFVDSIVQGFEIDGFMPAFWGALLYSLAHLIVESI
jgi:putative membrane protein